MKKITALLLAAMMIISVFALASCGGETETTTAQTTTSATTEGTTTNNENNETTTAGDVADETTTAGDVVDETTTAGDSSDETTIPSTDVTTTTDNGTTTVESTTASTPAGSTTIFNSEWGPFDTYDINTGERVTANMFVENRVTVTYATSITCSICKAWMKSYMNTLRKELEAKGANVAVVLIFAASHWEEEGKVASIVEEYKAWYKSTGGDYPFIVADEHLQKNFRAASVPLLHVWVGGNQNGKMVASFHGTYSDPQGGYTNDALYAKIIEAVDFWLKRV